MRFDRLIENLKKRKTEKAVVFRDTSYTFQQLEEKRKESLELLCKDGITPGQVIGLESDYSFESLAIFLALISNRNIVSLLPRNLQDKSVYLSDSEAEGCFHFDDSGSCDFQSIDFKQKNPLLRKLVDRGKGGFIIFSSGSTGRPKAILHDIEQFLSKFDHAEKQFCTLSFLLFDHIAGIDTLFYTLSSGGTLVFPENRETSQICKLIQDHKIEVLPTSPTFLNLLCLSGVYKDFDLSCLKIITYGSEPMNQTVLQRLSEIFPNVKLIQKYGTSEFGSPVSQSRGNGSLAIRFDKNSLNIKIIDNILWVKSESAMMGYLNAPNPFDEEGWYCTGDEVDLDGEWLHILGRKSDMIIVGGEKVYPSEVENAIRELEYVVDAIVRGDSHPFTGQIVCAKVHVTDIPDKKQLRKSIRKHCYKRLQPHKVPVKISLTEEPISSDRHKKIWNVAR